MCSFAYSQSVFYPQMRVDNVDNYTSDNMNYDFVHGSILALVFRHRIELLKSALVSQDFSSKYPVLFWIILYIDFTCSLVPLFCNKKSLQPLRIIGSLTLYSAELMKSWQSSSRYAFSSFLRTP